MAGKAHVDDSVIERRLRPIYEWLDAGNNKKAVQEADKVLRKQASLPCARVLKGLALLRLGRREECQGLVSGVVKEAPTDEATLQALTICFREMHQPEEICRVYETATKREPGNEELLSHLFMAYVRVSDYRNQQQTAMKLYRLKPKNPYYFWAVMSYVMQGVKSGDEKGRQISLTLAERMVNNFVKEGKIEAEAEVLTYLHILETQGKYAEALSVVEGELGSKIIHQPGNFLRLKRATYHTHLGQWQAAAAVYKDLIKDEHDNWQHYVGYIDAIMQVTGRANCCSNSNSATSGCPSEKSSDTSSENCTVEKCSSGESGDKKYSVCDGDSAKLAEECGSGGGDSGCGGCEKEDPIADPVTDAATHLAAVRESAKTRQCLDRGPSLGFLHLASTLHKHGDHNTANLLCGDFVDLLLSYITDYGDKMCCYADIIQYLPLIPKDTIPSFLEKVEGMVHRREDGVPVDVKSVYRDLFGMQARWSLGQQEELSPQHHIQWANTLIHRYHHTLHLTTNMADTDIRPCDPYLLLAAHSLLRAAGVGEERGLTRPDSLILLRVAAILEQGIIVSRANFQLKLLLIKVYNMMGACEASHSVYEKCDLKHIQLDTLGHTLALQALDSAHYTAATDIFSATLKFFMANYKDTSDPLISSYKYGSLTRIPEFVEFRERLSNSLHFATVTAEQMLLDLTTEVSCHSELVEAVGQLDIDPATDKTCWPDLRDNRDLRVMDTWDPPHRRLKDSEVESNVKGEVAMLKLRNVMLRLMAAACRLSYPKVSKEQAAANKENSKCVNGEASSSSDATLLTDLTSRLQEEYDQCAQYRASKTPQLPLQGPDPSRIYLYASCKLVPVVLQHTHILQHVYQYSQGDVDGRSGEVVKTARSEMETVIDAGVKEVEKLTTASLVATAAELGGYAENTENNTLFSTNVPESSNPPHVPISSNSPHVPNTLVSDFSSLALTQSDVPNSLSLPNSTQSPSFPNSTQPSLSNSTQTPSLPNSTQSPSLSNSTPPSLSNSTQSPSLPNSTQSPSLPNSNTLQPVLPRYGLASLHHLAQTLGISVALLGCCHAILRPLRTAITKKNKKRKEPAVIPEVMTQFISYVAALTGLLQRLEKAVEEQKKRVKAAQDQHASDSYSSLNLTTLLTKAEDAVTVGSKVELSYLKSLERLSSSIANKLKYVSSLKL